MHRTATFYDLKITARGMSNAEGKEASFETDPKTLRDIVSHLETLFSGGDRIVWKGRTVDSARMYISDMRVESDRLILLVNRSDPRAPNSVSSDPDNKSWVVHEKPPGFGSDFSAHVIINLDPVKGDNYYLCVIETVYGSGLHASSIENYLRYWVRHFKKQFPKEYMVPHNSGAKTPRGKPILVNLVHYFEFQGHPSDEFEKDLSSGTLSSMELLSFSKEGEIWDDKGGIIEKNRCVILRPKKDMLGDLNSAIRQVRNKVKKSNSGYNHIRLRFKNESGEPKDAMVSADSGKLVDSHKYVRRHIISAPMVNTTSLDVINSFIIKEISDLMR